jgi:hypothetical protein
MQFLEPSYYFPSTGKMVTLSPCLTHWTPRNDDVLWSGGMVPPFLASALVGDEWSPWKWLQHLLDWRLCGPHSRSGYCGVERNRTLTVQPVAHPCTLIQTIGWHGPEDLSKVSSLLGTDILRRTMFWNILILRSCLTATYRQELLQFCNKAKEQEIARLRYVYCQDIVQSHKIIYTQLLQGFIPQDSANALVNLHTSPVISKFRKTKKLLD